MTMRITLWRAVATALLIASCGGRAASQPRPTPLEGTSWKLAAIPGADLARDVSSTITFEAGGAMGGSDGCNRYQGSWTATGATIALKPGASTQMACPEPVMKQAMAFTAAMGGARGYTMDAGQLVLLGADGQRLATFVPLPVASLQGTPWDATMVNNGKGAVSSLVKGTAITAAFGADGALTGSAGCNRYTTRYKTDGDTITIASAATTRKMCPAPVMAQERSYLAALGRATRYRLDEGKLELRDAKGALQASFRTAK